MKSKHQTPAADAGSNYVVGPVSPPSVSKGGPHAKLPRDVSGKNAVKTLQRLGFTITWQKGSHIRLRKGDYRVTVPNHRAILPKTLQNIIRQAGARLDEFMDAL